MGVFGCNSGNTFINSKRKNINCNVLLSIQSMDKKTTENECSSSDSWISSIVCTLMDRARPCVTLEGFAFGWFRVIVPRRCRNL